MTPALVTRESDSLPAVTVTSDQLDLIRRTIAKDATPDELKLYLYDCQRQGVHPLDKLIHFTKRSGKYTPITSIDFMRIRAADSGEMAGSDDPTFTLGDVEEWRPDAATVTVYRLTQGQRFAYTATARWSEYKPDQNDFMWRKMPHTMLGKCAEALALRKGFPRQLAGLYAKEEMDQSEGATGYVVEPMKDTGPDRAGDLPAGAVFVQAVGPGKAGAACELTFSTGERYLSWNKKLADAAVRWCQDRVAVFPEFKTSASGNKRVESLLPVPDNYAVDSPAVEEPAVLVDEKDVPF